MRVRIPPVVLAVSIDGLISCRYRANTVIALEALELSLFRLVLGGEIRDDLQDLDAADN